MTELLAWVLCALGWAIVIRLLRTNEQLRWEMNDVRVALYKPVEEVPTQESEDS